MNSLQNIINEILNYVKQNDAILSTWYVGIASDPKQRLFNDHGVIELDYGWIFRNCGSSDIARAAEAYLINTLGFDGGSGGGDQYSSFVYAYKKGSHTKE
jgi:hypothetical protein